MKRLLAAAALLLASCDTYPPGDPYGAPYPPQDPYGDPYPADPNPPGPYPPGPYPPGRPYQPLPPEGCPIASSRDWRASIDASPAVGGQRPLLVVSGTVVAPTGGYRMEFVPYLQERRSFPVQLVARLLPIPPSGGATQALTTHDVRWQWPLRAEPVGSVAIVCGQQTLAEISPVPRTP